MKKKSTSQSAFFNLRLNRTVYSLGRRLSGAVGLWRVLRTSAAEVLRTGAAETSAAEV
jgi:hypothetical protein